MRKLMIVVPVIAVILSAATLCHSEEFWLAQRNLKKLVLTPAQKAEIAQAEKVFQKKWNHTHRTKGCSHHEAHADEFVATASGVLTNEQFKTFRKRDRNAVESVGYGIRKTGQHIDDLLKIARSL